MWVESNDRLKMTVGDYGVALPLSFDGITIAGTDSIKVKFISATTGETILVKEYSDISQNKVNLELSSSETALFPVGLYAFSIDWYQSGHFLCNLVPIFIFEVVTKA